MIFGSNKSYIILIISEKNKNNVILITFDYYYTFMLICNSNYIWLLLHFYVK